MHEGWNNLRLKSGLVVIPFAIYNMHQADPVIKRRLLSGYCILLFIASLYCLIIAGRMYGQVHSSNVFFYHALVKPLSHHAVYFSVFVFTALIFLFENINNRILFFNRLLSIGLILYFSILVFLLSSKLVIAFYLLYLFYYFMVLIRRNTVHRQSILVLFALIIVIVSTAITMRNPVTNRFHEILYSDMKLVNQDNFEPSDYFDGLQFRLLQWKFVPGILSKTNSWWTGVSPGDAQSYLDEAYISKHMYTGDGKASRGLLGYNTHNQFLEALLQTGIVGLFLFLLIASCLVRRAWKIIHTGYVFILLLLLAWLFSESVLETQYGIVIFTFFPLFFANPGLEPGRINHEASVFTEKEPLLQNFVEKSNQYIHKKV